MGQRCTCLNGVPDLRGEIGRVGLDGADYLSNQTFIVRRGVGYDCSPFTHG